jgi:hypothetical protein
VRPEPPVIASLRESLARHPNGDDNDTCATLIGRGQPRSLGVRGEKVAEEAGGAVYIYTVGQVKRILAKWDARVAA